MSSFSRFIKYTLFSNLICLLVMMYSIYFFSFVKGEPFGGKNIELSGFALLFVFGIIPFSFIYSKLGIFACLIASTVFWFLAYTKNLKSIWLALLLFLISFSGYSALFYVLNDKASNPIVQNALIISPVIGLISGLLIWAMLGRYYDSER